MAQVIRVLLVGGESTGTWVEAALRGGRRRVVGRASDGQGARPLVAELAPDVVLLLVDEVDAAAEATVRELVAEEARVLVLGQSGDPCGVRRALIAGAAGYVELAEGVEVLRAGLAAVARGQAWLRAAALHRALRVGEGGPTTGAPPALSEEERTLLELLAAGYKRRRIAQEMRIGERTVRNRTARLRDKLGVSNNASLVAVAVWLGLARRRKA